VNLMGGHLPPADNLPDDAEATIELAALAACIAAEGEVEVRAALVRAAQRLPPRWVEEVILQTYLFAGFPRALNAAREWRRASGVRAPERAAEGYEHVDEWRSRGEETCKRVYGEFYERLRHNIRDLHPALDEWMIVEGYGKTLSRESLDLCRRELCIVAVCLATRQERQLHSHLHGALNAGATERQIEAVLEAAGEFTVEEARTRARHLWARVKGK
jgi:4-carboxymuconolactone decarboxylase